MTSGPCMSVAREREGERGCWRLTGQAKKGGGRERDGFPFFLFFLTCFQKQLQIEF